METKVQIENRIDELHARRRRIRERLHELTVQEEAIDQELAAAYARLRAFLPGVSYSVDGGEPCSWGEFLAANEDAPLPTDYLRAVARLVVGTEATLDLGAGGRTTVRRVS